MGSNNNYGSRDRGWDEGLIVKKDEKINAWCVRSGDEDYPSSISCQWMHNKDLWQVHGYMTEQLRSKAKQALRAKKARQSSSATPKQEQRNPVVPQVSLDASASQKPASGPIIGSKKRETKIKPRENSSTDNKILQQTLGGLAGSLLIVGKSWEHSVWLDSLLWSSA